MKSKEQKNTFWKVYLYNKSDEIIDIHLIPFSAYPHLIGWCRYKWEIEVLSDLNDKYDLWNSYEYYDIEIYKQK